MDRLGGTGSTTVLAPSRERDYECGTQGYCSDEEREGKVGSKCSEAGRRRRLQRNTHHAQFSSVVM